MSRDREQAQVVGQSADTEVLLRRRFGHAVVAADHLFLKTTFHSELRDPSEKTRTRIRAGTTGGPSPRRVRTVHVDGEAALARVGLLARIIHQPVEAAAKRNASTW